MFESFKSEQQFWGKIPGPLAPNKDTLTANIHAATGISSSKTPYIIAKGPQYGRSFFIFHRSFEMVHTTIKRPFCEWQSDKLTWGRRAAIGCLSTRSPRLISANHQLGRCINPLFPCQEVICIHFVVIYLVGVNVHWPLIAVGREL